jgi:glycosyltransferase involved in cell wall biosynthesis
MADVGLALVRQDPAKRASAPTKVGEYLACGLAVAATEGVGDLNDHFRNSDIAITVAPSDPPGHIVDRILEALKTPDRVAQARALAEREYDLETGVEGFAAVYRALLAESPE